MYPKLASNSLYSRDDPEFLILWPPPPWGCDESMHQACTTTLGSYGTAWKPGHPAHQADWTSTPLPIFPLAAWACHLLACFFLSDSNKMVFQLQKNKVLLPQAEQESRVPLNPLQPGFKSAPHYWRVTAVPRARGPTCGSKRSPHTCSLLPGQDGRLLPAASCLSQPAPAPLPATPRGVLGSLHTPPGGNPIGATLRSPPDWNPHSK